MENGSKPIRYIIEDKHFSLDDKFVITDESGDVQYTVGSTLFVVGAKLVLYDADGKELIKIRKDNLHLHKIYNVYSVRDDADEMQLASIKQKGAPWHHKLEIHATNGEYLVEKKGGMLSHEFILTKDGETVATVTKGTTASKSVYYVDVASDRAEYRAFLVAMVIVLSRVQSLPGSSHTTTHGDYDRI